MTLHELPMLIGLLLVTAMSSISEPVGKPPLSPPFEPPEPGRLHAPEKPVREESEKAPIIE